jgi:hypothetical protein
VNCLAPIICRDGDYTGSFYLSREQANVSIFEYIEVFYNREQRHSHIGQMAPLAFEAAKLAFS